MRALASILAPSPSRRALGTLGLAAALAIGGAWAVHAQDAPEGEGGGGDDVAQLLRRLVRETRGVREAVAAASARGGASDLETDVRAIRDALKPGEIAVVRLPGVGNDGVPAPAETQERQLNDWAQKGFRLVAVSAGYAYLQK